MSLARRLDYELARAREWRGREFVPLPGAEAVERELDPARGLEAVVRRARNLLGAPGEKALAWLSALALLLVLLAAAGGAQVARLALGDPAQGPVNIVWFLGHALGLQSVLLVLTLLVALGPRTPVGRLLGQVLSLGGLALGAAVRLASRRSRAGAETPPGAEALERLRSLRALRPLALTVSHGAWTAFNLGLLAAAAAILYAEHHAFAWQSTLLQDEARAERVLVALTLPSRVWPGGPTPEQVRASRFDPQTDGFVDDLGNPPEATRLRQAWSTQLLASVAGYGLLPRVLLLLLSWLAWRFGRSSLEPSPGDPYGEAVLARLAPPTPAATETDQAPLPEPEPVAAEHDGADEPVPQALAWLNAAQGEDLAALLGPGWRALPRLDSRGGERAALEALKRPAELVLFCDLASTPDASLRHWLREAAPARLHLVLTGGAAFRKTGRGASAEQVAARHEVWERAASGLGAGEPVDFDAGSATAESLQSLRERFAREGAAPAPRRRSAAGLDAALERVREAASDWQEGFAGLEGPELEAEQLRSAARIREAVEGCFAERPSPALVGPAVVKVAKTTLRGAMEGRGLRDEAWSQALGEAARLGRLLARVKEIDPRWSAAGLVLGLVAGPLGGAIAAGSAGLVAGASLTGTLAPLGAALGSALSLRRRSSDEDETAAEAVADALGLPARAGTLRALELELQGRGEEKIAKALGELARSEAGRASLDGPEAVAALCDEAARIAEEGGEP